jgi:hypothetical protein
MANSKTKKITTAKKNGRPLKHKKPQNEAQSFILVPGGYRPESAIKLPARMKGKNRVADFGRLKPLSFTATDYAREVTMIDNTNFIRHFGPPSVARLNSDWKACAAWNNNTGNAVSNFTAKIKVPPPPAVVGIQTIFIFIGIQNSARILQPVLQWGRSRAGGGRYWSVGSWLAGSQADPILTGLGMTRVASGDMLIARISLIDSNTTGNRYRCGFDGINASQLLTNRIPELKYCCVTLESYLVREQGNYPPVASTDVTHIAVTDINGSIQPPWQFNQQPGPLGEHAAAGSTDIIRLFY